ncbi:porin [Pararobbsia silviterrae]|uniref:Porin n=1 Tax=Pararobbsia silviterrae TaxID=1792498 RepID=A0A494Y8I7_9BURK|nr:porin [Pararobbsia silviterrae]RKP58999.1 porin [Pararobbsia silviterrae]
MKRLILSSLSLSMLAAAGAAQAQNSVTLYGVIDEELTFVDHANQSGQHLWTLGNASGGDLAGTRFGMKGNEDLGGGTSAIFTLEGGFDPSTGKSQQGGALFGRQSFVGLTNDQYGTFTLGKQYDPVVDFVQPLTGDNYFGSIFATPGDVDNYDNSSRTTNSLKYVSPTISGFQVEGMYAFGGVAGTTGSGQTWSVAAQYNNGPFGIAAGYWVADNSNASLGRRDGWSTGATSTGTFDGDLINGAYASARSIAVARVAGQYVFGPFTFGLSYSNAMYRPDTASLFGTTEKYNSGSGFANYQATPALLLGLGYTYMHSSGNTTAIYNQGSLGADYSLSKRTDVYLVGAYQHANGQTGYLPDTITDTTTVTAGPASASIGSYGYPGTSEQVMVSLGLRHRF